MENTKPADTFSQVKADGVAVEVLLVGDALAGAGSDFVLYWRGICSRV